MLKNFLKGVWGRDRSGIDHAEQSQPPIAAPSSNNSEKFFSELLFEFYNMIHVTVSDNFDYKRYGVDAEDRSRYFFPEVHAAYMDGFFERRDQFFSVYQNLSDEVSQNLFRRLILYRLLGHLHVKISDEADWPRESSLFSRAENYDSGPSVLGINGPFGLLHHYEGIEVFDGKKISLDGWDGNIVYTVFKRQYFFQREGVTVCPEPGDVVIDAGACFGDSAVYFACAVGGSGFVHSFDPLQIHCKITQFNIDQNNFGKNVKIVPFAVGDENNSIPVDEIEARMPSPGFSMMTAAGDFPSTTLDAYFQKARLAKVDFIKMDIEGYELKALEGAKDIIKKYKPKLAISIYHKPFDLIDIPSWIMKNFPFYRLYIDHYTIHQEETVLFALPQ